MASWSRWNIQKAKMWYNELEWERVFIGFGGKNTKISNICHLLFCKSPYEISQLWPYPFFPVLLLLFLLLLCKIRLSLAPLFWVQLMNNISFHLAVKSHLKDSRNHLLTFTFCSLPPSQQNWGGVTAGVVPGAWFSQVLPSLFDLLIDVMACG